MVDHKAINFNSLELSFGYLVLISFRGSKESF